MSENKNIKATVLETEDRSLIRRQVEKAANNNKIKLKPLWERGN